MIYLVKLLFWKLNRCVMLRSYLPFTHMAKETSLGSSRKKKVGSLLIVYSCHVRITVESSSENKSYKKKRVSENILIVACAISYCIQDTHNSPSRRKGNKAKVNIFSHCANFLPQVDIVRIGKQILW